MVPMSADSGRIDTARDRASLATARALGPLVLVAFALAAAGCGKQAQVRQPRVPVTVARVERRTVPLELAASGTVEAVQSASVGSQVGGVVTALLIREGQDVRSGQPLVQLDPRPLRAAYDQARGQLGRDRAQFVSARADADRAAKLLEMQVLSQADYDTKTSAADALRGTVIADSAAMRRSQLDLAYATIRSPVAGRAGAFNVHIGDYVKAASSDPLVTVVQLRPIRVRFTIPETQVASLRGRPMRDVRVVARPASGDSSTLQGRLTFIDNAVDPATGTLLLKGEFENRDGRLVPGQLVDTRLVLANESDRLVVPAVAVTSGQQGTYVYVMNADSTASPRNVDVARTQGDLAVVTNGLEAGETVVTDGQFRLSPGSRVLVRKPAGAGGGAGGAHGAAGAGAGTPARAADGAGGGAGGGRSKGNPS